MSVVEITETPVSNDLFSIYDLADGAVKSYGMSGFKLSEVYDSELDEWVSDGAPSASSVVILGSEDLTFGLELQTFTDEYGDYTEQVATVLTGKLYDVRIDGTSIVNSEGPTEYYPFLEQLVRASGPTGTLLGIEAEDYDAGKWATYLYHVDGEQIGATGVPTIEEMEALYAEFDAETLSIDYLVGTFDLNASLSGVSITDFTDFETLPSGSIEPVDPSDPVDPELEVFDPATDAINFELVENGEGGYTVEVYANPAFIPEGQLSSFRITFDYEPTQIIVDDTSASYNSDFTIAVPGAHDTDLGTWFLGGTALSALTSFDTPLVTFDVSLKDGADIVTLGTSDTLFGTQTLPGNYEDFDFSAVTVSGTVESKGGDVMSGVTMTIESADQFDFDEVLTDVNGDFAMDVPSGQSFVVDGHLEYVDPSMLAVTPQDALEVLRLSLGLTTTGGSQTARDLIASDFDGDGSVTPQDALEVLKASLGIGTYSAKWVFVDALDEFTNIQNFSDTISYDTGVNVENISSDIDIALEGILIGDIDNTFVF